MRKYGRLREDIKIKFGTLQNFAKELDIGYNTLVAKLSGKNDWKVGEIEKVCHLLDIAMDKVQEYFFYN